MHSPKTAPLYFALLLAATASCQTAADPPAPLKIGDVTVTGSVRTRVYFWDWFEPTSGNNTYAYSATLLRLGFSQNHTSWDWNAEFAVPLLLGIPSNATGTGPQQGALGLGGNVSAANNGANNTAFIFPKQLFVRFNGLGGDKRQVLQLGRFEFNDGTELAPKNATVAAVKRDRVAQRLIGTFGFSDVGRSFDGVHYSFGSGNDNLTFVGAVPTAFRRHITNAVAANSFPIELRGPDMGNMCLESYRITMRRAYWIECDSKNVRFRGKKPHRSR